MSVSRRSFLVSAGAAGVAGGAGAAIASCLPGRARSPAAAEDVVPFFGEHQPGIATPSQEFVQFCAFDVVSGSLADVQSLMRTWSAAAALLAAGKPVGSLDTGTAVPGDTGEGVGLPPARLSVTFGFGASLFTSGGQDRFGLAAHRPLPLVDLPAFPGDALDPALCGGDVAIQICADDPQVAFHGLHNLIRAAGAIAMPRWVLAGFGRTRNSAGQSSPRNLMGFKDGTANIMAEDDVALVGFPS